MRAIVPLVLAVVATAASPAHADPRSAVQDALGRVVSAGGFVAHVNGHVFGPGMPVTTGDIDVLFPDRIHARTEAIDFVSTPAGAWVNLFGVWTEVDREQIPITAFEPGPMRKAIASIGEVRAEGSVMTTACEQHIYRFRATGQLPGAQANGDARIWICEKDGRPARLEATDADSGAKLNVAFDWSRRPLVEAPE
jgi:outer membrane lipoprotein-sorting protein